MVTKETRVSKAPWRKSTMARATRDNNRLAKKYRHQKRLIFAVFAGNVLLLASILNLAAAAVVQHYENKPTVYEVKYSFSDQGNLERFDRLVRD